MKAALILTLALAAAVPGPRPLGAQARALASPGAQELPSIPSSTNRGADAGEPGLDREVFVYPGGDRRDPFERLLPGDSVGTRFEELRLMGVILSSNPRKSVALLSAGTANTRGSFGEGSRTFRVRQNAVLGDVTVIRVERESVFVEISRFGVKEQFELHLERQPRRDGG